MTRTDQSSVPAQSPPDDAPGSTEARVASPSVISRLGTGAARRWPATLLLLAVVLAIGGVAFGPGLDREGFPPVNTPIVLVTGAYFVDDAEQVDADVVAPLEQQILNVDGVVSTQTTSQAATFLIVVELDDAISSDDGVARLVAADIDVPQAAQIDYRPLAAASFLGEYEMLVSVVGEPGVSPEDLQAKAQPIAAALEVEDAIAEAEVRDLITDAIDPATGQTSERLTQFTRVALDQTGYRPAIAIGVKQAEDSDLDVLALSDRVQQVLDQTPLDQGFAAQITADFAVGVRSQLSSLAQNLGTGLLAVALVSLLLIGWRVSVVTAAFMGIVMAGALALLWGLGFSLNTITLFGLILTLGLLVDDAIVISESIDAHRDEPDPTEDDPRLGVISTALSRVGSASLAGTLTTVVVFSPMLFIGGILGEFIRPIPTAVIATLLASFLFSILFIPLAARFFLLRGGPGRNPVVRGMRAVARQNGRLAAYPSGNGLKGHVVGALLGLLSLVAVGVGGALAGGLGFSIFPSGSDAISLTVGAEFPPGTTIEQAQDLADQIDEVVIDVLGQDLVRSQYTRGNERVIETFIDLTPIGRGTTAPEFVEQINEGVEDVEGARISVAQVENGPPVEEFPFAAQIDVTDQTADAGRQLAADIAEDLQGQQVDVGSDSVAITQAIVSTDGVIARTEGTQYVEVRAAYADTDSLTSLLTTTQQDVQDRFGPELAQRGLPTDALRFDFGFESENQENFAALGTVGVIALLLMLVLIAVQFRSVVQSLLIFLAIPFSFLGVFTLLTATDNPLSFLVAVGFIALIGVAVNNTILLVEAANRARDDGASAAEAIREAVERRFRPLVATTVTTVVGLLPLALSDPFWESLGFTLIGGLVSSTLLVLISFPVFYLALEAVRTPVRNAVRRRRGRSLIR